jgi:hypothetical protein
LPAPNGAGNAFFAPKSAEIAGFTGFIPYYNNIDTYRVPGNGETAPSMAATGAFGSDSTTPGSGLPFLRNKDNNIHNNSYIENLPGGEGLKNSPDFDFDFLNINNKPLTKALRKKETLLKKLS